MSNTVNSHYFSVLLAWTLSNGALAAIVVAATERGAGSDQKSAAQANAMVKGYMAFLLFSVAGLACTYRSLDQV
jgi:chitin synthase